MEQEANKLHFDAITNVQIICLFQWLYLIHNIKRTHAKFIILLLKQRPLVWNQLICLWTYALRSRTAANDNIITTPKDVYAIILSEVQSCNLLL